MEDALYYILCAVTYPEVVRLATLNKYCAAYVRRLHDVAQEKSVHREWMGLGKHADWIQLRAGTAIRYGTHEWNPYTIVAKQPLLLNKVLSVKDIDSTDNYTVEMFVGTHRYSINSGMPAWWMSLWLEKYGWGKYAYIYPIDIAVVEVAISLQMWTGIPYHMCNPYEILSTRKQQEVYYEIVKQCFSYDYIASHPLLCEYLPIRYRLVCEIDGVIGLTDMCLLYQVVPLRWCATTTIDKELHKIMLQLYILKSTKHATMSSVPHARRVILWACSNISQECGSRLKKALKKGALRIHQLMVYLWCMYFVKDVEECYSPMPTHTVWRDVPGVSRRGVYEDTL